jgi:mono/diheme cytochrome c family protein
MDLGLFMSRSARWVAAATLLSVAIGRALSASAQSPEQANPTASGIYSTVQAARGADAYQRSCAACHKADLRGDADAEVPALVDDEFMVAWERLTVGDLVTRIARTMPGNRPGSLPRNQYLDIAAFLLQSNRFPAGPQDLPDDDVALDRAPLRRP